MEDPFGSALDEAARSTRDEVGNLVAARFAELRQNLETQVHKAVADGVAAALERRRRAGLGAVAAPYWGDLSRQEQDLHLRAQRFARVKVAAIRLYRSQAVKAGRAAGDLYAALGAEFDAAREAFRGQFLTSSTMIDYLHLEILRTLANNDSLLLGPAYPGPLV